MAIVSREELKSYFAAGARPTQAQFEALIDTALGPDTSYFGEHIFSSAQDFRDSFDCDDPLPEWMITLGVTEPGDGGGGFWYRLPEATPGTYVDDLGTILVPTSGDCSVAMGRDMSYHPMGIPVQAFGIFGAVADAPCEWVKWEAMLQSLGGDIGGDAMLGGEIYCASPRGEAREFVIRAPLMMRDNITLRIGPNTTIWNKNEAGGTTFIGDPTPTSNLHGSLISAGAMNPEYFPERYLEALVPKLVCHALESAPQGSTVLTFLSAADAANYSVNDRVYIINGYRQLLSYVVAVDGALGTVQIADPLFWPLTRLTGWEREYALITNISTDEGRNGAHFEWDGPSDPLFSGPSKIYVPLHAVRNVSIIGSGPSSVLRSSAAHLTPGQDCHYGGEISNLTIRALSTIYSNALTHVRLNDLNCLYRLWAWEMADGYYNSPMTNCQFQSDEELGTLDDRAYLIWKGIGQGSHHSNIKIVDTGNHSIPSLGTTYFFLDDAFGYDSSITNFDYKILTTEPQPLNAVFSYNPAYPTTGNEDGNPNAAKDAEHAALFVPHKTKHRHGKITIATSEVNILYRANGYPGYSDGGSTELEFDDVEFIYNGTMVTGVGIQVGGGNSGVLRNVKSPGTLWVLADPNEESDNPTLEGQAAHRWVFDNVSCDRVYSLSGGWDGLNTNMGTEIVPADVVAGALGWIFYNPRVASDSKIIRTPMRALKHYEEVSYGTFRADDGFLWRFSIPPALPFVLGDELVFKFNILARNNEFTDTDLVLYDRATDEDSWQEFARFTNSGNDPGWDYQAQHFKELTLRVRPFAFDWQGQVQARFAGSVSTALFAAEYKTNMSDAVQYQNIMRGVPNPDPVDALDWWTNGHQIAFGVVYPDGGSVPPETPIYTYCQPEFRANLRWWPR